MKKRGRPIETPKECKTCKKLCKLEALGMCKSCYAKNYYKNSPGQIKKRSLINRNYRNKHKEYFIKYLEEWRKNHPKYFIEKLGAWRDDTRFGGNRLKVIKRDGNRCVVCGTGLNLIVHHIDNKGRHLGDSVKLITKYNNRMENLITLCNICHNKVPGKYGKRKE